MELEGATPDAGVVHIGGILLPDEDIILEPEPRRSLPLRIAYLFLGLGLLLGTQLTHRTAA